MFPIWSATMRLASIPSRFRCWSSHTEPEDDGWAINANGRINRDEAHTLPPAEHDLQEVAGLRRCLVALVHAFLNDVLGEGVQRALSVLLQNLCHDQALLLLRGRAIPRPLGAFGRMAVPQPFQAFVWLTADELRQKMPSITRRQLRLALVRSGISLGAVEAAIGYMAPGHQKDEAEIEWADAASFDLLHPKLLLVAAALDLPADQVLVLTI